MSRTCDLCGRGSQKTIKRSHANNKTISRQFVNLQAKTINGSKKKVCTRCIRTMKKNLVKA